MNRNEFSNLDVHVFIFDSHFFFNFSSPSAQINLIPNTKIMLMISKKIFESHTLIATNLFTYFQKSNGTFSSHSHCSLLTRAF